MLWHMKPALRQLINFKDAAMQEKVYTVTELAEIFSKTRQTIHNWIDAGRFPNHQQLGGEGGTIAIPASDVETVRKEEAAKLLGELDRLGFQTISA